MIEAWSPDWSYPVFSLQERDRRWAEVRRLMAEAGLDVIVCLPCTSNHDRGQQDSRYLTQLGENCDETTVVFPGDGPVTARHSRGGVTPSSNWLTDIRAAARGAGGATAVAHLRELGFHRGVIGIAGLAPSLLARVRSAEGDANWRSVEIIREAFPEARVVSATEVLGRARYVKSEEEIDFLRRGTEVAETSLAATVEAAGSGVREQSVFASLMQVNIEAGGSCPPKIGWISGPLGNTYRRLELPTQRRLEPGDVVVLEIEGRWAGYAGQADDTLSIGPPARELQDGMKLAWEAFDRAVDALRVGASMGDVVAAGSLSALGGRARSRLVMHGRGLGDDGPLITGRASAEAAALPVTENTVFILKPAVEIDGRPDFGRWGDTVVVRAGGAQRLGRRPQRLIECRG